MLLSPMSSGQHPTRDRVDPGGVPFRQFPIQKAPKRICPLPSVAYEINDYQTCMAIMHDAEIVASQHGRERLDPIMYQYAGWFNEFANADSAVIQRSPHQDSAMVGAGCRILLLDEGCQQRGRLWPAAQNSLASTLARYHTGEPLLSDHGYDNAQGSSDNSHRSTERFPVTCIGSGCFGNCP